LRPFFSSPELTYSVFENFNTSLSINFDTPLQATDAENDPIQYYILDGGAGYLDFDISTSNDSNTWSGYLYFKNTVTLDRESRDEYNVRVYARDNQDHGNAPDLYVDIVVNILDINDVTPLITNSKKTFDVAEDTDTNSLLFQVTSRDDDAGQNGVVTYSLLQVDPVSGADKFTIYSSSGEVYLSQSLDYEGIKEYELTIEAEDLGADPLKTSGIFTIVVTDVNDNPPTFEQTLYSKQIYENVSIGSLVLTVTAYDQDRMIDDDIEYYFNSSQSLHSFLI
jgi:protocadherin Fat 4